MKTITIQSFFGIGDLLFVTPTLRVIKEAYPDCKIIFNTDKPLLLKNNPYVDEIGDKQQGVKLMYTAPDTGRLPLEHHIIEDWRIVCNAYDLITAKPELQPELYIKDLPEKEHLIGVQVEFKFNYHGKRVWPEYERLAREDGFEAIPHCADHEYLIKKIASYKVIVCPEGGVSHIAAALHMPAVVIFGGFSDPKWTGYKQHVNITSDVICKHCYNHSPCSNGFVCWEQIHYDHVKELALFLRAKA